jgi:hypothetical protein
MEQVKITTNKITELFGEFHDQADNVENDVTY